MGDLINIGILATTLPDAQMKDMHRAEGTLLFQIMIHMISGKLSEENWMNVLNHCCNLLEIEEKSFMIIRVLGVFLSAMIFVPDVALNFLNSKNALVTF